MDRMGESHVRCTMAVDKGLSGTICGFPCKDLLSLEKL